MGIEEAMPAFKVVKMIDQLGEPRIREIMRLHAGIGAGIAFVPIPFVAVPAMLGNVYTMYARINSQLGIKFSENIIKSVGGMLTANIASFGVGIAACEVVKFIPIIGTIGGAAAEAAINFALIKVQGELYCQWLKSLCKENAIGADGQVNERTAKTTMEQVIENADIGEMIKEAKKEARSTDLKKYKNEARELMEEEQRKNSS